MERSIDHVYPRSGGEGRPADFPSNTGEFVTFANRQLPSFRDYREDQVERRLLKHAQCGGRRRDCKATTRQKRLVSLLSGTEVQSPQPW